jgi:hypothetical protein
MPLTIPLARWADRQLRVLAEETGSNAIAALNGPAIVGERGSAGDFFISGRQSAGKGGGRILRTRDHGWFALTMLRDDDRLMLHALLQDADLDVFDDAAIAQAMLQHDCPALLARGRDLGLPVASVDEVPQSPSAEVLAQGPHRQRESNHRPLVIDLSAIWAGPLTGHLLWLAGAEVVKIENPARPDLIRIDDPATYDVINQGKANVALDLTVAKDRDALIALIRKADVVIESSRVRALRHLGVDGDALVREVPGLVWLTITGHGATGEAANWAGIGHDCGVAGGLARELANVCGEPGYVGDALADPLTGITAAIAGWRAFCNGTATRIGFAMSAIVAQALSEERGHNAAVLETELRAWGAAVGRSFPKVARRILRGKVSALGADTAEWLARC